MHEGRHPTHIKDKEKELDIVNQEEHEADRRLNEVFGDTVHRNDGRHIDGGVIGDKEMCELYDQVVNYPHPMYSPPTWGPVGRRFLKLFVLEMGRVRKQETNSERAMILPVVILRKEKDVNRAQDIKRRLTRRMDQWEAGHNKELVADTVTTARRSLGG